MLQSFKDRLRSSRWLGYLIVGAISVPFALWGIQAYMGGGGQSTVAEVNGVEIPAAEVERQVSQRRQMLRERFGGELPSMFTDQMLREQVVEQLVSRELLRQAAADANLQVDAETISREIRGQSWFQRDGSFDRDLYRQTLAQSGLTAAQYEANVREGQRLRQLRQGVVESAFVLPAEARHLARLERQQRLVTSLQYPRAAARESVEVDDAAIEEFYERNEAQYRTPEQVRLAYLEMDLDALASQVEVSEDELREAYEAQRQQARQQSAREAAHILIEVPGDAGAGAREEALAEARALRERIVEEDADFARLAREHSDDRGSADQGGNLGYVTRGTMVEPFEQALFGLSEAGAVSEPVRTGYGYHLIKFLDERAAEPQSFEEARDGLEQELRRRRAEARFYERVELLRNSAYENPGTLEAAAEATDLEIRRSDWIARGSGSGIGEQEAVREAAFSEPVLEQGQNSEVLKLGPRRVAVIRVVDHRQPEPQPLEAVRDRVREALVEQRVDQRLQAWSEEVGSRLNEGATIDQLAEGPVERSDHGWLASAEDADAPSAIVQAAFAAVPPPGPDATPSHRTTTLPDGTRTVVLVRDTRLPAVADSAVEQIRQQRSRTFATGEFQAWVEALRAEADIQRSDRPAQAAGS